MLAEVLRRGPGSIHIGGSRVGIVRGALASHVTCVVALLSRCVTLSCGSPEQACEVLCLIAHSGARSSARACTL